MNLPDVTEFVKAGAPALAALVSLIHPAAAALRRRRSDRKLRELIRTEVAAAVGALLEDLELRVSELEEAAGLERPCA